MSTISDTVVPGRLDIGMRKAGIIGLVGFFLLIGVLGVWSATTVIGGAVVTYGQAVVRGDAKVVQSLDGGIIESIAVETGDFVTEGQLLLRLDPTLLAINLDIARGRLAAALALRARLQAEQQGASELIFNYPALPFERPLTEEHEIGQLEIFLARAAVLQGEREKLAETLQQFASQNQGIEGQISAVREQIVFLDEDLASITQLISQGLARQSQLSELQRARAEMSGRLAALEADLARLINMRRDSELSMLQEERSFKEDVVTELREVTTQVEELTLEIVTRSAQLDRVDIRAPADGIIHDMQMSTVGGIVAPGATILEVIPLGEGIGFELQVDPGSIDQVYPGQPVQVVMSAFDRQTTPKLEARVSSISASTITDERTGQRYFRVSLIIPPEELSRLGDAILVPGMPVEAYLETGDRTVLSYLMSPLASQLRRAFRE